MITISNKDLNKNYVQYIDSFINEVDNFFY